ncbi:hypothetical protein KCU78_g3575, partial [Aureobasidium melanogenum]
MRLSNLKASARTCYSPISNHYSQSARPCVSALAFARSFLFNMACLSLLHLTAQRSADTPSLLLRHHSASKQVFMRMRDLQVSALVIPVCSMQPWLQVTWTSVNAPVLKIRTASRITWTTSILMNNETPDMSSPAKSTTMSDIIRALDETRERIVSMGIDELQRERVDSFNSLKAEDHPKWLKPIKAFDQKKYLSELESGDITLRQIQVATNSTKLPEEHVADYIRVNGKLPEPKYGPGKCTYDPYPLPPKRKRDVISRMP